MLEAREVSGVLAELALETVSGKDGRKLSDGDKVRLSMLVEVAERLGLSDDAERLRRLLNVAQKGFVSDIEAAALKILTGDV